MTTANKLKRQLPSKSQSWLPPTSRHQSGQEQFKLQGEQFNSHVLKILDSKTSWATMNDASSCVWDMWSEKKGNKSKMPLPIKPKPDQTKNHSFSHIDILAKVIDVGSQNAHKINNPQECPSIRQGRGIVGEVRESCLDCHQPQAAIIHYHSSRTRTFLILN